MQRLGSSQVPLALRLGAVPVAAAPGAASTFYAAVPRPPAAAAKVPQKAAPPTRPKAPPVPTAAAAAAAGPVASSGQPAAAQSGLRNPQLQKAEQPAIQCKSKFAQSFPIAHYQRDFLVSAINLVELPESLSSTNAVSHTRDLADPLLQQALSYIEQELPRPSAKDTCLARAADRGLHFA